MCIKLNKVNYFIADAKMKTVSQIFREIFLRMDVDYVSEQQKREYYKEIREQLSKPPNDN